MRAHTRTRAHAHARAHEAGAAKHPATSRTSRKAFADGHLGCGMCCGMSRSASRTSRKFSRSRPEADLGRFAQEVATMSELNLGDPVGEPMGESIGEPIGVRWQADVSAGERGPVETHDQGELLGWRWYCHHIEGFVPLATAECPQCADRIALEQQRERDRKSGARPRTRRGEGASRRSRAADPRLARSRARATVAAAADGARSAAPTTPPSSRTKRQSRPMSPLPSSAICGYSASTASCAATAPRPRTCGAS